MLTQEARGMLFNCCRDFAQPDWKRFDWLETGGCTTETNYQTGESWTNGSEPDEIAEFWTVYGHYAEGGCEAITDCWTRASVAFVASELSKLSGLQVR